MSKYIENDNTNDNNHSAKDSNKSDLKSNLSINNSQIDSKSSNSFNIKDEEEEDELEARRYEIQCELNNQGASDLVVDLFMSDTTNKVFKETVLLAIALLEGGNTQVQVRFIEQCC